MGRRSGRDFSSFNVGRAAALPTLNDETLLIDFERPNPEHEEDDSRTCQYAQLQQNIFESAVVPDECLKGIHGPGYW